MCLQLVQTSKWKIACILRSRAFHDNADLLHIFKAKIWSYLEYRTSVIYHCNGDLLAEIDSLQERFLAKIGMCRKVAALHYSFLPLCTRRDIAMLGMLHRTRLGHGPSQFQCIISNCQWFASHFEPICTRALHGRPVVSADTSHVLLCVWTYSSIQLAGQEYLGNANSARVSIRPDSVHQKPNTCGSAKLGQEFVPTTLWTVKDGVLCIACFVDRLTNNKKQLLVAHAV